MQATRVTFIWEETPEMTYDDLISNLIGLGADDIETEEIDIPDVPPIERPLKKKSEA